MSVEYEELAKARENPSEDNTGKYVRDLLSSKYFFNREFGSYLVFFSGTANKLDDGWNRVSFMVLFAHCHYPTFYPGVISTRKSL